MLSASNVGVICESAVKLLTLVRQCGDFMRHYRVYLSGSISSACPRVRALVVSESTSAGDIAPTDDVSGLYSLPLTDRHEWVYSGTSLPLVNSELQPWGAAWLRA